MKQEQLKQSSQTHPFLPVIVTIPLEHFDADRLLNDSDDQQMVFTRSQVTTVILSPKQNIRGRNGQITITRADGNQTILEENPLDYLRRLVDRYQIPKQENLPFVAGLIGYFSYEFAGYAKDVDLPAVQDELDLPDFDLFLTDVVINYSADRQELSLSQLVADEGEIAAARAALASQAAEIASKMAAPATEKAVSNLPKPTFTNQFSLAEFTDRVQVAQDHIYAGDIFQLILSNPYLAQVSSQQVLPAIAARLKEEAPSPYHFYFHNGAYQAVGASPETLIKKTGQRLFSYPLAGTRRRGKTQAEDDFFAQELMANPKEQAEHNMLVDLGRNDLGRVSAFGTVRVTAIRQLLRFPNVMHLGSTIESQAQEGISPIDILAATLPAGTLSGAPKLSAMQIIAKLEDRKRGIYGGGIGTIGFDGDVDLCIGIRLAYQQNDQLVVHSGAGIVADSQAKQEYQEFENKSRLMMNLLKGEKADALVD